METLVRGGSLEGTASGGDCVVGTRLTTNSVRRIGIDQVDGRPVKQAIHVLGLAAVTAEQTVLSEQPKVPWLGRRLIGRFRHIIWIGNTPVSPRADQTQKLNGHEAHQLL